MELFSVNGKINAKKLAVNVLVPVAGGTIAGLLANRNTKEEYKDLEKPSFSPPSWVFPAAWTTLYTVMGIAQYRVRTKAKKKDEAKVKLSNDVQLGLNFLWSFLFFKWGLRGTALAEVATLLAAISWTAYEYYQVDKTAGTLMLPYIGWVMFALGLNYSVWKLNK